MCAHVNATTVVGDLQQLQASILDENLQGRGSCVDSILHQLLQRIHRGHDNFPCSNFVDNILVKGLDRFVSIIGTAISQSLMLLALILRRVGAALSSSPSLRESALRLAPRGSSASISTSIVML